jgi:hypothetical protein
VIASRSHDKQIGKACAQVLTLEIKGILSGDESSAGFRRHLKENSDCQSREYEVVSRE